MLYQFLNENKNKILDMTMQKSQTMSGVCPTSDQLRIGLPYFYSQLMETIKIESHFDLGKTYEDNPLVKKSAGELGIEMLKVGYTLSNVVHFYGCLCQAITQFATEQEYSISSHEFHDLNRCLDDAIAGAVTDFQKLSDSQKNHTEVKRCGFCAHELRNSLGAAVLSYDLIKMSADGFAGSLGQVLDRSLKRMDELIGRSLAEVKLTGSNPQLDLQPIKLQQLVDQLLLTANVEAKKRNLKIEVMINSDLTIEADLQFFHSALSNLIQNALKFTHDSGKIQIRANPVGSNIVIEVEDECGGLSAKASENLFRPFEQFNENRKGLGLGLALARKAIELHHGEIAATSLPGTGCIFKITMPANSKTLFH